MLKFLYPKKNHRFNVSILNFLNNLRNLASLAATLPPGSRPRPFPDPPRHLSDLSRVNFTRGTDRDSEQFAPVARISPPPTRPAREEEEEDEAAVAQSYITRHYLFLSPFPAPRSRPSELPSAARTAALTTAQKRPFVASSSRIRSLECTHTLPSPTAAPFKPRKQEKAALSPRVIECYLFP